MKNRKTIKVAALITLVLLLANEAVFYFTSMPRNPGPLFFMFLGLNTLIAVFLYALCFLVSTVRDANVATVDYAKDVEDHQALEAELRRIEDQKREAENQQAKLRVREVEAKAAAIMESLKRTSIHEYADSLLVNLSKCFEVAQGLFFLKGESDLFSLNGSYAFYSEQEVVDFELGEGLAGQVAKNKKLLNISDVPEGYVTILSGTGKGQASHLLIFPIVHNNKTIAIVELASFMHIDSFGEEVIVELSRRVSEDLSEQFSII